LIKSWQQLGIQRKPAMPNPLALSLALALAMPVAVVPAVPDIAVPAVAVQPVAAVDLERFEGSWFEIARIPAWFQNRCARDTTARYQRRSDGRITVINRCLTRGGRVDAAEGLARVLDPATNARLQVSFVSLLGWRPFWGWILSRSNALEPNQLEAAYQSLERNGYARERFVLTPQGPAP
jgi:apolipoprotein D and lipocalin family protein